MRGRIRFFIRKLSVEFYYPYLIWNNVNVGLKLDTDIMVYKKNTYSEQIMDWSLALKVLGVGVGFAWNYCDNPKLTGDNNE